MREIAQYEAEQTSGGDLTVSINSTVPAADEVVFAQMLGNFLTGQLDAAGLATYITANAANFNDMKLNSITIGNFVITPSTAP